MEAKNKYEVVHEEMNFYISRLEIDGGWIYNTVNKVNNSTAITSVFVPTPSWVDEDTRQHMGAIRRGY